MTNKYDDIIKRLGGSFGYPPQETRDAPVSKEEIDELEAAIGYPLPQDYREFLRDYAGVGFDAVCPIKYPTDVLNTLYPTNLLDTKIVSNFLDPVDGLAIITHKKSIESPYMDLEYYPGFRLVKEIAEGIEEIPWPEELFYIAYSPNASQFCLALGGLRPGAIFLILAQPEYKDNVYVVADSFDEFMHSLYLEE